MLSGETAVGRYPVEAVDTMVRIAAAVKATETNVHPRPPSFCTGCPERPIFTALKLVERELGTHHVSCDIGCHLFSILPPFNIGATTMGYGLGGAGAAAFNTKSDKRAIAFVGDQEDGLAGPLFEVAPDFGDRLGGRTRSSDAPTILVAPDWESELETCKEEITGGNASERVHVCAEDVDVGDAFSLGHPELGASHL